MFVTLFTLCHVHHICLKLLTRRRRYRSDSTKLATRGDHSADLRIGESLGVEYRRGHRPPSNEFDAESVSSCVSCAPRLLLRSLRLRFVLSESLRFLGRRLVMNKCVRLYTRSLHVNTTRCFFVRTNFSRARKLHCCLDIIPHRRYYPRHTVS